MKTTKQLLGLRIKEIRKTSGMSQEELAEKVGIDPKHLSRIEVGKGYPSLDTLESIATALNQDIRLFFDYSHLEERDLVDKRIFELIEHADLNQKRTILRVLIALLV
ncbi:helix-turn-helix domain-containing protein [Geomobilimonas luticola]|uniref:Helix-turn-helix transcriptional regulator n=1 Tax=Geomobilimonas luticola TaxID=1114878 RepID=A0ABS5S839_9BACT|nr:helix-turn-helix transcriptional regulator [Geomobilimonas luticola]MBT0651536.1 helix-turn-helix transcriptional regulator [Geomobilimonas luticola]